MIDDAIRGAFLGQLLTNTAVVVAAAEPSFYERRAAELPGIDVVVLDAERRARTLADATILVDGLEAIDNPALALRRLRDDAPRSRVFALVANGAHARILAGFADDSRADRRRPLVRSELMPLFVDNGWIVHDIAGIPDATLMHEPALPVLLRLATVSMHVTTVEERERLLTAAYVVVADPT